MLKHALRYSSLSLALLCASAMAQPTPAELEYTKFKTQNFGEIHLETGTRLRFEVTQRETRGAVEIVTARLLDPYAVTDSNYRNLIVTLSPNTGDLVAFAETTEGHFDFNPAGDATRLWRKSTPPPKLDDIYHPKTTRSAKAEKTAAPTVAPLILGEKDSSGRYVVDVFIGFSTAAAVTGVSGRGVGMDAVKDFVAREGGSIRFEFVDNAVGADFRQFQTIVSLPEKFAVHAEG